MERDRLGIILVPFDHPAVHKDISPQLQKDHLSLSFDTEVVGISPYEFFYRNLYAIKVRHKDLPESEAGESIPFVRPIWNGDNFQEWQTFYDVESYLLHCGLRTR